MRQGEPEGLNSEKMDEEGCWFCLEWFLQKFQEKKKLPVLKFQYNQTNDSAIRTFYDVQKRKPQRNVRILHVCANADMSSNGLVLSHNWIQLK